MPVRKYKVLATFNGGGWECVFTTRATTPWEAMERVAAGLAWSALKDLKAMDVEEVS